MLRSGGLSTGTLHYAEATPANSSVSRAESSERRWPPAQRDPPSLAPQRSVAPSGIVCGPATEERDTSYAVDFVNVSTVGLESSPVATALAGLRANEARYFKNKYDHVFTVEPAAKAKKDIDWVHRVLKEERDIAIASRPLEATTFQVENIRWTYVFYESGLSINVLYPLDEPKKRAVGFKLSEGMEVPPSSAPSTSRDRNRSWPGRSAARTS